MKKVLIMVVSVILLFMGVYQSDFDVESLSGITGAVVGEEVENEYVVQDVGGIEIYFCPRENCEKALVEFVASAEESIHCALFEIGLKSLKEELISKAKEIDVKIVTDNDYADEFNTSFTVFDGWGLMHNKFCIIDGKKVSTGSMNPTENGAHKNNNNLVLFESSKIAEVYEKEFQEMWKGTFKSKKSDGGQTILLGDSTVSAYFCPEDGCAEKVKDELKKATKSVHFMTFSFTHSGIGNILLLKHEDGVTISGVMEARGMGKTSQFARLNYSEIDVSKDGNKGNMHHKVFIIDEKTVITGSFNPTNNGNTGNDENLVIIENENVAARFMKEFEYVYERRKID